MKEIKLLYRLKRYGTWKNETILLTKDDFEDKETIKKALEIKIGAKVTEFKKI